MKMAETNQISLLKHGSQCETHSMQKNPLDIFYSIYDNNHDKNKFLTTSANG